MGKRWRGILYLAFLSLSACFGGEEDVKTYVDEIKKTSVGKVNPLPPGKEPLEQSYTAKGLRSPFQAAKQNDKLGKLTTQDGEEQPAIVQAPRPDANRKREFLERYPLSNFTMVGSISKGDYIWGLVQDNNGLVYPIQVGDYIGENSGHVTAITEDKVSIEETVEDGYGGWIQKMTELEVRNAEKQQTGA